MWRTKAVKLMARTIKDATQQTIAHLHDIGTTLGFNARTGEQRCCTIGENHDCVIVEEADDFRIRPSAILTRYAALATHGSRKGTGMDNLAIKATHTPGCI